jgi:purine-binding chemotaxis protein CheW
LTASARRGIWRDGDAPPISTSGVDVPSKEGKMQLTLAAPTTEAAAPKSDERAGKYLTFVTGKAEFGIAVLKVREILGILDITAVPQTPAYLKGVINLRGKIIPVIDLRLKFGLSSVEYTQRTCIIVVQVKNVGAPLLMGIVVDEVSEVLTFVSADIEDTPDFGANIATYYILGMAKVKGKVKILLNIDQVLAAEEIRELEAVIQ